MASGPASIPSPARPDKALATRFRVPHVPGVFERNTDRGIGGSSPFPTRPARDANGLAGGVGRGFARQPGSPQVSLNHNYFATQLTIYSGLSQV
jgi:hypothetical protein